MDRGMGIGFPQSLIPEERPVVMPTQASEIETTDRAPRSNPAPAPVLVRPHTDWIGKIVGMLVFLMGVALLGMVFYYAFDLFKQTPSAALGLHFTGDPKKDPALATIGSQFAWLLFRVAFLFIMSIAASLIANKGINLYFASWRHADRPPA